MQFSISQLVAFAPLLSSIFAAPFQLAPRSSIDCTNPPPGLSTPDCLYLSKIGFAGTGTNALTSTPNNNNLIYLGTQGPNIFSFINTTPTPLILIFWHYPVGDYSKLFMSAHAPAISFSLAPGQNFSVSVAHGVSGGWAGLYDHKTILDPTNGLVQNTWGEFITDPEFLPAATTAASGQPVVNEQRRIHTDVSRLVWRKGSEMKIQMDRGEEGCVSDFGKCVFECKGGGGSGEVWEDGRVQVDEL